MKKLIYLALFAAIASAGCRKIEVDGNGNNSGKSYTEQYENTILEGRITSKQNIESRLCL